MNQEIESFRRRRPISFNVLCILAFGFGGISILVNFYLIFTGSLSNSYKDIQLFERLLGSAAHYNGIIFSVLGVIISIVAFVGVIQMWNQLKIGFWLFSISKLLYLALPFLLLNIPVIYLVYIMLPFFILVALFIFLFSFNLKYLD